MPLPKDQAWFGAKAYGYGWGLPKRWQGWVVFVGYIVAMLAGAFAFPRKNPGIMVGYAFACTAVLCAICAWKGEKPRWRWGDTDDAP